MACDSLPGTSKDDARHTLSHSRLEHSPRRIHVARQKNGAKVVLERLGREMKDGAYTGERRRHRAQVRNVGRENFVVVGGFLGREINAAQMELRTEVSGDQAGDVTGTASHY